MKSSVVLLVLVIKLCIGDPSSRFLVDLKFEVCDGKGPHPSDCLRRAVQNYFSTLDKPVPAGSYPELYEPFRAQSTVLGPGESQFAAQLNLTDIRTYGWAKIQFEVVGLELKANAVVFKGHSPYFRIQSQYWADGRVLGKPFKGEGVFTTIIENVAFRMIFKLESYERDGNKHVKVVDIKVRLEPERVRFDFGNQSESLNREINENWEVLFNELRSGYENVLGLSYRTMADFLLDRVPLKVFVGNTV